MESGGEEQDEDVVGNSSFAAVGVCSGCAVEEDDIDEIEVGEVYNSSVVVDERCWAEGDKGYLEVVELVQVVVCYSKYWNRHWIPHSDSSVQTSFDNSSDLVSSTSTSDIPPEIHAPPLRATNSQSFDFWP